MTSAREEKICAKIESIEKRIALVKKKERAYVKANECILGKFMHRILRKCTAEEFETIKNIALEYALQSDGKVLDMFEELEKKNSD